MAWIPQLRSIENGLVEARAHRVWRDARRAVENLNAAGSGRVEASLRPCKPTSRVLAIDVEAGGKRSQVRLMVDRRGHVYCRTQRDRGLGSATRCCQSTINLVREAITVEADRLTVSRPDPRP